MFQNQWEFGTSASWVKGKHILSVGTTWDHTQLNILNNNTKTDNLAFETFQDFVEGNLHGGTEFAGSANRYYRSDTVGTYINDNFKMRKDLTVTAGLRWDIDGPLSEKYGKLTGFDPSKYSYVQCKVNGVPADPALTSTTMALATQGLTSLPAPVWSSRGITRLAPRRESTIRS